MTDSGAKSENGDRHTFGMQILTKTLDNWQTDAWLVQLDEPIKPVLKSWGEYPDGSMYIDRLAMPKTRHVVVSKANLGEYGSEVMVFPAFASGEYRGLGDGKQQIAGPTWGTHLDALDELAEEYVGLECDLKGERDHPPTLLDGGQSHV